MKGWSSARAIAVIAARAAAVQIKTCRMSRSCLDENYSQQASDRSRAFCQCELLATRRCATALVERPQVEVVANFCHQKSNEYPYLVPPPFGAGLCGGLDDLAGRARPHIGPSRRRPGILVF